MDVGAVAPRLLVDLGRHAGPDEPAEDVADRRLPGLVAEEARDDPVLDHAAHALGEREPVAEHELAGARAHHRDHRPGRRDADGRDRDVGVDVGDRDGRPRAQARPARRRLGQPAGHRAEAVDAARHLVVDDRGQAGLEAGEERRVGEAVALRPLGLVARGAGVAGLRPGELPHDPVGRLDQPVRRAVDARRLVEDLEALGVEPLRRDPAAVARQPRLAARLRPGR